MIGQVNLQKTFTDLIEQGKLPKSMIICGRKGSGKKTISEFIGKKMGVNVAKLPDCKVDTLRTLIEDAYSLTETTIYVVPNLDNASVNARNILLKVIEEPPTSVYFIITCSNIENILDTIKSRCQIYYLDNYTPNEIVEYCNAEYNLDSEDVEVVRNICTTFRDVDILVSYNIKEFVSYVDLVIKNIEKVQLSNSFKIGNKLSFKKDDGLYNLELFFRIFSNRLLQMYRDDQKVKYLEGMTITGFYLNRLSLVSINKQMVFDTWLMEIRSKWRVYGNN